MIRYSYYTQKSPAVPFALLNLRHPQTGAVAEDVVAQIDTAADRTLLPLDLVQSLGLNKIGEIEIEGVGGTREFMPLFDVFLGVGSLAPRRYEVVAHADED